MPELETKALRFPFAGTATFIRRAADGTDSTDPKDIYTTGRTVMGAVTSSWSLSQEELADENSMYPAARYPTGVTENTSIVMRTEDPDLDMFLKGSVKTSGTNVPVLYANQPYTVGADNKISLLDKSGAPARISTEKPVLVRDFMTSADYVKKDTPTAAMEYKVDPATGVFTFSTLAVGKQVFITVWLVAPDATIYTDSAQVTAETLKVILSGPAEDFTSTNPLWVTKTFDSMQLSGDYSPLARQKGPGEKTVQLQTTKPRGCESSTTVYSKRIIDQSEC